MPMAPLLHKPGKNTMLIPIGTLAIIILVTFLLGMLTAFVMMLNALSRMKK
jgi:hypothetical protein